MSKDKIHQPIDQHDQHERTMAEPRLAKFFRATIKQEASDLHLKANKPPHIRIRGTIMATLSITERLFSHRGTGAWSRWCAPMCA